MTLGEKIRACRRKAGLTQEQLAEAVGVSRQAVTKWEQDQSAPGTAHLMALAQALSLPAGELLEPDAPAGDAPLKEALAILRAEEEKRRADRRRELKRRLGLAAGLIAGFLAVYLAGRLLWCREEGQSLLGMLFLSRPQGAGSYLFGWLTERRLYWLAMAVSAAGALAGKRRFALTAAAYSLAGLLLGMVLGPNPDAMPYEADHYGWAYWCGIFLTGLACGCWLERLARRGAGAGKLAAVFWGGMAAAAVLVWLACR